ncbi:TPA: hypothetical protein HA265_00745 [Candidatus Woesearchaeota archaeon]|nr:hypothetical protein [Candidatus Woesearchaeota archaeon]
MLERRAGDSQSLIIRDSLDSYLFLLMGATASGKSVMIRGLKDIMSDITFVEKDTTRPRRAAHDVSRRLISPEEFDARLKGKLYFLQYQTDYAEDDDGRRQPVQYGIIKQDLEDAINRGDSLLTFTFPDSVLKAQKRFDGTNLRIVPVILTTSKPEMLEDRLNFMRDCDGDERNTRLNQVKSQWDFYQKLQGECEYVIFNDSPAGLDAQEKADDVMGEQVIRAVDRAVRKFRGIVQFYQKVRSRWPIDPKKSHFMFVHQVTQELFGLDYITLRTALKASTQVPFRRSDQIIRQSGDPMMTGHLLQNVYATSMRTEGGVSTVTFNEYAARQRPQILQILEKYLPGIGVLGTNDNEGTIRYALTDKQASNSSIPYALDLKLGE